MEKFRLFPVVSWLMFVLGVVAINGEIRTFRSPAILLGPGEVVNNVYAMEMPSGNVGIKSLTGDVVDEDGNSVPLSEVYLHHWIAIKLHVMKNSTNVANDSRIVSNSGVCQSTVLPQFYGLGSETRHTEYHIPEPYVIEIGNREEVPPGYEEQWSLNVHAIDVRGAVSPTFCLECRCASYNVSVSEYGKKVPEEYVGGLECCVHGSHCVVKEGFHGTRRTIYFQYTVEYFPMEPALKPVRVYIVDVTDDRSSSQEPARCEVEYDVLPCDKSTGIACRHEKHSLAWLPEEQEVDVVYATGHLHAGGISLGMHGEDGRNICTSEAIYGTGHEAGNETGYIVGMQACYPEIGTLKIKPGETLHIKSVYSNKEFHTGVMGLVYVLVADPVSSQHFSLSFLKVIEAVVVTAVAVAVIGIIISFALYVQTKRSNPAYESLIQA